MSQQCTGSESFLAMNPIVAGFRLVVYKIYLYQKTLHQYSWPDDPAGSRQEEKTMKIVSTIARYLLGLTFLTFGLNGFLNFIPMPPPTGTAAQFFGAIFVSRLYVVLFVLQIAPALLLLVNRYVPLAL